MRIALLISGEPRFSKLGSQLFHRNVKTPMDVFVHTWSTVMENKVTQRFDRTVDIKQPLDLSGWSPRDVLVEPKETMKPIFTRLAREIRSDALEFLPKSDHFTNGVAERQFINQFGQFISFARSVRLMKPFAHQYDLCIRARQDLYWGDTFDTQMQKIPAYMELCDIFWPDQKKIFVDKMLLFEGGYTFSDTFMMARPSVLIELADNMEATIAGLCGDPGLKSLLRGFEGLHRAHRLWTLIVERIGINFIPFRFGSMPIKDAPEFQFFLLRPGIDEYPMDQINEATVYENSMRFDATLGK